MHSKNIVISLEEGLHVRPISKFVRCANKFDSKISVIKGHKTADGKSIISLISLGINENDKIKIIADGNDEEAAILELQKVFKVCN